MIRHLVRALGLAALLLVLPAYAQVPQSREQIRLSFAPVTKKAAPAVVNIYTKTRVQVRETLPISPFINDPFFNQFFAQGFPGRTREQLVASLGSGVIVGSGGMIVTSNHVIRDAEQIIVVLSDKREFEAKVIKRDPQADLAFLSIEAKSLPSLELRDSDTLEVGELVLAIGNPFGVGQTVTSGIISALSRQAEGVSDYQFFIQTDAAINPGNSGGALVDMDGKLIGINTAIYSKTGGSLGIGFAIPANMVRVVMGKSSEGGKIQRSWMGLAVQPVTSEMAESLGLPAPQGVIVQGVAGGSPAEKSGIKSGDVVLALGGSPVSTEQELKYRVALSKIGEKQILSVLRAGKRMDVPVTVSAPPEVPARDQRELKGNHPLGGLVVANLSPALAEELEMDAAASGVVVMQMVQGSFPNRAGMMRGDIILEVNGVKVTSTRQLESLLKKGGREWRTAYRRGDNIFNLIVRM